MFNNFFPEKGSKGYLRLVCIIKFYLFHFKIHYGQKISDIEKIDITKLPDKSSIDETLRLQIKKFPVKEINFDIVVAKK